jgi:NADPH-dependent glutamate synthase beta subunit-like oxidoreductase
MKKEKPFFKGRIAVVGSGPAGLSAAYFLAIGGLQVDLFEREARPGGMLRYGIPEYRLPRNILDKEIQNIFHLGVNFFPKTEIRPESIISLLEQYAYAFFSPGLWGTNIPDWGYKGEGVYDGLSVLKAIHSGNPPELGQKIAVVGGGNTALDVTRVLMRLGKKVVIIYRRTLNEAPAFKEEIREALEEHITVFEKKLVSRVEKGNNNRLKIEIREATKKDGKIAPSSYAGAEEVDSIVAAIGQVADTRVVHERVLVGGDYETGEGTVVHAIASGKRGALEILRRMGIPLRKGMEESLRIENSRGEKPIVGYEGIKGVFFEKTARVSAKKKDPDERIKNFDEVVATVSVQEARLEANRCFSCGTCTSCGTCWYFCPDACITMKLDDPNEIIFNLDFCKGCAFCSTSCPCGCIVMEEEE